MARSNWRVLAAGPSDRLLLAVDFGPGRAEATFADLAGNLDPTWTVWETTFTPARHPTPNQLDPGRCVEGWLDEVRGSGLQVCAVLGYCAGAALGWQLADRLRLAGGGEPLVMLINPTTVDGAVVRGLVASFVDQYADVLPAEQCEAALRAVAEATDRIGADFASLPVPVLLDAAAAVQREYDDLVGAACRLLDVGEQVVRGFSDRFASFLSYLLTAGRAVGFRSAVVSPLVFVSQEHQLPSMFGAASRRFPVSRAGLLADDAVAREVGQAVAAATA